MSQSQLPIFFLQFEVTAKAEHIDAHKIAGAICNCWVQSDNEQSALQQGEQYLLEQDWQHLKTNETMQVDQSHFPEGNAGAEYFEQARQQGFAAVFHIWSPQPSPEQE